MGYFGKVIRFTGKATGLQELRRFGDMDPGGTAVRELLILESKQEYMCCMQIISRHTWDKLVWAMRISLFA